LANLYSSCDRKCVGCFFRFSVYFNTYFTWFAFTR